MTSTPSPRAARGLFLCATTLVLAAAVGSGCRSPNAGNIVLRKENQQLRERVAYLERLHNATTAPTVPATTGPNIDLANAQYGNLYTVHSIRLGTIAVERDLDYSNPPVPGLKVYVYPTDQAGDVLKASGTVTVEAFDLAKPDGRLVGKWEFPPAEVSKHWYGSRLIYAYIFKCPWTSQQGGPPPGRELTVKVTFVDELTRRQFSEQGTVNVPAQKQ